MADDKKQQNTSNTTEAKAPVKRGAKDENNGSKSAKTRMIYRHHRKFMGGGLVGLILFAFLVGTETLPLYKKQADGAVSQGQHQTAIKVLERQHGNTNTDKSNGQKPSNAQNTKKSTEKSVVARNGGAHRAEIKIHENIFKQQGEPQKKPQQEQVINAEDDTLRALRQQVKNLHKITHGQQQMIRMLTQKQNKQKDELTEKMGKLRLQLNETLPADKPTLQKINESFTLLQLRQDALFFYNQWQEGLLTADTLRQWEKFVANKGLNKAARFTIALRQSLEKYGLLNRQALQQTAKEMHLRITSDEASPAQSERQNPQAEQERSNKGWWQKLKDRLAGLVRIKRMESDTKTHQEDVNGKKQELKQGSHKNMALRENASKALAQGDMKTFWALILENQNNQNNDTSQDPVVKQLRLLVEVHMMQMDVFQQLYRTLTAAKTNGE